MPRRKKPGKRDVCVFGGKAYQLSRGIRDDTSRALLFIIKGISIAARIHYPAFGDPPVKENICVLHHISP
jgi:hypothetical protein